jgi:predicted RNA-binding protein with PIN domain
MHYLIDGYNLLYAMGVLHGRTGPTGLRKARLGLLGLLKSSYADQPASVTVVFDAAQAPAGAAEVVQEDGIEIRFAVHEREADDLIEALIRRDAAPRQLTVVSDDHRIQQAARRRGCLVLGCGDFLDELAKRRRSRHHKPAIQADKPLAPSGDETQYWLEAFAELSRDPRLKELSDPVEWLRLEMNQDE